MATSYLFFAVVPVVVIIGAVLAPIITRRIREEQLYDQFEPEYNHTMQTISNMRMIAHTEVNERSMPLDELDIRPLSSSRRERYSADWAAIQSRFDEDPEKAIVDADRIIIEFMRIHAYPVSDFEQEAADPPVSYPPMVKNFRAAHEIAIRNEQHLANTEELRQAMIYYQSLFEELLEPKAIAVD